MTEADLLALSDAVLALSLDTINFNLWVMQAEGVIRNKWVLAWIQDPKTKEYSVDDSKDMATKVTNWVDIRAAASTAFASGDFVTFGTLMSTIETNYTGAWNAYIDKIYIDAIPNVSDRVLLKIAFSKGELAMPDSTGLGVTTYDMAGVVYAFETKLSSLTVNIGDGSMLPKAESAAKTAIKKTGLGSEYFTIESIFMDLQQSNIANFSKVDSKLPEGADTAIAVAISTLFNNVMSEDEVRKYMLGYAVQQNKLKTVEKAIFQPTAISYSTTYVKPLRGQTSNPETSFNFHLQVDGGKPETQQVLPDALLSGHMTNPEVDGVFALRYSKFDDNVLDPIIRPALIKAVKGFSASGIKEVEEGSRWQITASRSSSTHDIEFKLKSDDGKKPTKFTDESITVTAEVRPSNGVLQVVFTTELTHKVRYEAWRFTKLVEDVGKAVGNFFSGKKQQSVGKSEKVLEATCTTTRGRSGVVQVDIKPGALGKLSAGAPVTVRELDVGLSSAYASAHFADFFQNYEAIFSGKDPTDYLTGKIRDAVYKSNPSQAVEKALSDQVAAAVNMTEQVDALSVVMPLGNLYTFKDLSIRKNSVSKVLEATVGYAPVNAAS